MTLAATTKTGIERIMQMYDYYDKLTQEEKEKLQELIGLLYKQTFLLERKFDRKSARILVNRDYYFCELHMEFLEWFFRIAGVQISRNTDLGTIYIQGQAGMGERLPKLATIYLLLLKLIYDEQMAAVSSSVNVVTTFGELGSKVGEFRLTKSISSMTEMKRALSVLRKYQMIELMDSLEELEEHSRIVVYPCINVVLMREDMVKLLDSFGEEEPDENRWVEPEDADENREESKDILTDIINETMIDIMEENRKGKAQNGE